MVLSVRMMVVIFWRQVALEREEILLELHEGRKAEEEAFKEQLEMEENIKRRLRLRLMSLSMRMRVFLK